MFALFISTLQQSMLFLPLTLGIYITYRIMKVTDLTVEASFVLGAAVFAKVITSSHFEVSAFILALIAGGLAGLGVAGMQLIAKIDSLIASVIGIFMLYSVNFTVMGMPNISLLSTPTLIQNLQNHSSMLALSVISLFVMAITALICYLLHTRIGLLFRAYGSNPALLARLGKRSSLYLILGLVLSNMLAGLSGVLTAQVNGYADLNMGLGSALTAIGALVVGLKLVGRTPNGHHVKFNALFDAGAGFLGVVLYFLIMNILLYLNVNPIYLKFLLGLVLVGFLSSINKTKRGSYVQSIT